MATYTTLKNDEGKVTAYRFQIRKRGYKEKTRQFPTKAKGERWAKKTESEMDAGTYHSTSNSARWTLGAVMQDYIDKIHPIKPFGKTKHNALLRLIKLPMAKVSIVDLTAHHFLEFSKVRAKNGAGPKTVADDIGYMSKALTYGRAILEIPNATKALNDVRPVLTDYGLTGSSESRERRLEPGEFEALMSVPHANYEGSRSGDKHLTRLRMKYIIPLALETTMRESEIARMKIDDVDFEKGELIIYQRKHPTKKERNDQVIPLTEEARKVLREYLTVGIYTRGHPLFWPVTAKNMSDMFNSMAKVAGINKPDSSVRSNFGNLTFHDLRHEAISRLFAEGYKDIEVMLFSGHTDMKSLVRYVNLTPSDVLRAKEIRRVIMEHRLDEISLAL
jgi:integrase|tara:strand:- start:218 stop:1387 length:1170 start_codon:yes stop_codon:yes gene_type:complete